MGELEFVLERTLNELGIKGNHLSVHSGIRPNTIGDIKNGDVKSLKIETLQKILISLNEIAESKGITRTITLDDLITFRKK